MKEWCKHCYLRDDGKIMIAFDGYDDADIIESWASEVTCCPICGKKKPLEQALSGRTVSCSNCNEAAEKIAELEAKLKELDRENTALEEDLTMYKDKLTKARSALKRTSH